MAKYVAPDKGVRETTIGNKTYRPDKGGLYNVENASHARAMKAEGYFEASLMGPTTNSENVGYTCTACGFGSWFIKCGRCEHENEVIKKDGD